MAEASNVPSMAEALFRAVEHAKVRTISSLLIDGADVNIQDSYLQTPLMRAVYVPKEDVRRHIIHLFIEHGSDVNSVDDRGRTALMLASFESSREDVVRLLIRTRKCDPNIVDVSGNTALMYAAYNNNASVIRILVHSAQTKHIIKTNVANFNKQTALDIALKLRHNDCVRILVKEANVDTSHAPHDLLTGILNQDQLISTQFLFEHRKNSCATLENISIHSKSSNNIPCNVEAPAVDLCIETNVKKSKKGKTKRTKRKKREVDSNSNCTFEDVFAVSDIRDALTTSFTGRLTSPSNRRTHLYGESMSIIQNGLPPVNVPFSVSNESLYPEYTVDDDRLVTNAIINAPQTGSDHSHLLHNAPGYESALKYKSEMNSIVSPVYRRVTYGGETNNMRQGLKRCKQLAPLSPRYISRYHGDTDKLETDGAVMLPSINGNTARKQGASFRKEYTGDDLNRAKTV